MSAAVSSAQQKSRHEAGLSKIYGPKPRAVLRDHRATERVVDAHRAHVDILLDILGTIETSKGIDEVLAAAAHEEMVIFDRDRPARREAGFKAGPDSATPTRFAGLIEDGTDREANRGGLCDPAILIVRDGCAALHVPEHVVPGVADLAGEEADGVDLGLVQDRGSCEGSERADVRSFQVRPVALRFEAEHPVGHLPAIAALTA